MRSPKIIGWASAIIVASVLAVALVGEEQDPPPQQSADVTVYRLYDLQAVAAALEGGPLIKLRPSTDHLMPELTPNVTYGFWSEDFDIEGIDQIGRFIISHIQAVIEPDSWDSQGVFINRHNWRLGVRHRPDVHERIEVLLSDLAQQAVGKTAITVIVHWITVPADRVGPLLAANEASWAVDADARNKLGAKILHVGRITCRDGQVGQIGNGTIRRILIGTAPLIDVFVLRPITRNVLSGVKLEVQPLLIAQDNEVLLRLNSAVSKLTDVTRRQLDPWTLNPNPETRRYQPVYDMDLPTALIHKLSATCRVPLNQPTLVGAMTLSTEEGPSDKVLCLIVQVTTSAAE